LRFSPTVTVGKKCEQTWRRYPVNDDDRGEYDTVWSDADLVEPGFDTDLVPEFWLPGSPRDRRYVKVQDRTGRYLYCGCVRGGAGCGDLCNPHHAAACLAPSGVVEWLSRLSADFDARHDVRRTAEQDAERAELARFFGLDPLPGGHR
jgi:hypothetical protein